MLPEGLRIIPFSAEKGSGRETLLEEILTQLASDAQ